MSTVDPPHQGPSTPRGFTLLEVMVAVALVSLLALVSQTAVFSTTNAEQHLSAITRVTERGQRVMYEIREAVDASRRMFSGDAVGTGYLGAMDFTRDPMAPKARLPVFDEVNDLGPDAAGDPRTGNVLLFARETDAAPAISDPANKKIRYIDTYRFVCIYPRDTDRYIVSELPKKKADWRVARDLVMWRSVVFPHHGQIMGIVDPTERANVVMDMVTRFGYRIAWDPNGLVGNSFYPLTAGGTVSPLPTAIPTIDEDEIVSGRGRVVFANAQLAPTNPDWLQRRSVFTKDDPATWTPDGWEVKVVGPSGARKVWMHLVLEVQVRSNLTAVQTNTAIASTRDL